MRDKFRELARSRALTDAAEDKQRYGIDRSGEDIDRETERYLKILEDEVVKGITIGLFGTCGGSEWRDPFMSEYRALGINYFNPQVENWDPSMADEEARHLAEDQIILFPVTDETYGIGSLSEVGFSILQAIRLDDRREFIIMIAFDLNPSLSDQTARKESLRARALVKQHLKKLRLPNLYLVDSLSEMLEVSLRVYNSVKLREPLKRFNPQNRI